MPVLARAKRRVALKMQSTALEAEAKQTSLCAYLSIISARRSGLNALIGLVGGLTPSQVSQWYQLSCEKECTESDCGLMSATHAVSSMGSSSYDILRCCRSSNARPLSTQPTKPTHHADRLIKNSPEVLIYGWSNLDNRRSI